VSTDDRYLYPGTSVLRNKFDLKDADALESAERVIVAQRAAEGVPLGDFDLDHLRNIHRHLFQDLYDWAGEIRTVEIAEGAQQFQFRRFIETGMADVHRRLADTNFLGGLSREEFVAAAAQILGDVNYVHPFREGNGRVQLFYFEQLAAQAGHPIDLTRVMPHLWIEASRSAHDGNYEPMAIEIGRALATGVP
jgi:cell filamentation protein